MKKKSEYVKIIISGKNLETYEYERKPNPIRRRNRRKSKDTDGDENLGVSGQDTFSERKLGKRQDHARHAGMDFRRLVTSNLVGTELPVLVTLTYKENITDISVGYKDYRSFIQSLRYKYGKVFRYVCVPEFQGRGAVHFHALFWGLPAELFLHERKTRLLAGIWAKGFVYVKFTDGHEKISSYLSKYMQKAFIDPRLRNQKAYVASRNIKRPYVKSGSFSVSYIIDDYVGDDSSPVIDKTYDTKWLGKCRYRVFKASN